MKKKIIMLGFVCTCIIAGVTAFQKAKAVPYAQIVQICSTQDANGHTLAWGNTCGDGESICRSNPCPPAP